MSATSQAASGALTGVGPASPGRAALAAPARRRIFELIADSVAPVGVAELARSCGLHENTVRLHLARLVDAGLVAQELDTTPRRGRPGYRYRASAPDPDDEATAYRHLAVWLAEAVRDGLNARAAGRRVGAQAAARHVDAVQGDILRAFFDDEGFLPRWEDATSADAPVLVLGRCPFAAAAQADPTTICALHLGLAEGAAATAGDLVVNGLDPSDPAEGGCRLHLRLRRH
jgi:predicted ArsR family transcriptional regulator